MSVAIKRFTVEHNSLPGGAYRIIIKDFETGYVVRVIEKQSMENAVRALENEGYYELSKEEFHIVNRLMSN